LQEISQLEKIRFDEKIAELDNANVFIATLEKKMVDNQKVIEALKTKYDKIKYETEKEISSKYKAKLEKLKKEVETKEDLYRLSWRICEEEKSEYVFNLNLCDEKNQGYKKIISEYDINLNLCKKALDSSQLNLIKVTNIFDEARSKLDICMQDRLQKQKSIEKINKKLRFWKSFGVGAIVASIIVIFAK